MEINFKGKIGLLSFIHRSGIQKRIGLSQCHDLSTSYKNLVKFGTVTSEFKGSSE